MKKLVCELCGSDDIVKQEGCFVCQQCGTKYSLEEAKRMMMEGGDAAPGITVKVDNSSFVERYLQNARRHSIKIKNNILKNYTLNSSLYNFYVNDNISMSSQIMSNCNKTLVKKSNY